MVDVCNIRWLEFISSVHLAFHSGFFKNIISLTLQSQTSYSEISLPKGLFASTLLQNFLLCMHHHLWVWSILYSTGTLVAYQLICSRCHGTHVVNTLRIWQPYVWSYQNVHPSKRIYFVVKVVLQTVLWINWTFNHRNRTITDKMMIKRLQWFDKKIIHILLYICPILIIKSLE